MCCDICGVRLSAYSVVFILMLSAVLYRSNIMRIIDNIGICINDDGLLGCF